MYFLCLGGVLIICLHAPLKQIAPVQTKDEPLAKMMIVWGEQLLSNLLFSYEKDAKSLLLRGRPV